MKGYGLHRPANLFFFYIHGHLDWLYQSQGSSSHFCSYRSSLLFSDMNRILSWYFSYYAFKHVNQKKVNLLIVFGLILMPQKESASSLKISTALSILLLIVVQSLRNVGGSKHSEMLEAPNIPNYFFRIFLRLQLDRMFKREVILT